MNKVLFYVIIIIIIIIIIIVIIIIITGLPQGRPSHKSPFRSVVTVIFGHLTYGHCYMLAQFNPEGVAV